MASQKSKNAIFNACDIVAACVAAKAEGGDRPLAKVFEIAETARPSPKGPKYMDLYATVNGVKGRLMIRFKGEKHVGQIEPADDAEVARINAERGDKYGLVKKRERHPALSIQKYPVHIETDDAGRPKGPLPGPEGASQLYMALAYLDEFFCEEMEQRLADQRIVAKSSRHKEIPAGAVTVANTQIASLVQTHVSENATNNAGAELVNPIARCNMKFDKDTHMPMKIQFFDFNKSYVQEKKKRYEPLTFDGNPVTGRNIHLLTTQSIVSGILNVNAVCASNLALSIPTAVEIVVVDVHVPQGVSLDDLLDDDDDEIAADEPASDSAAAEPTDSAAAGPTDSPTAMSEGDLEGILGDMGGK